MHHADRGQWSSGGIFGLDENGWYSTSQATPVKKSVRAVERQLARYIPFVGSVWLVYRTTKNCRSVEAREPTNVNGICSILYDSVEGDVSLDIGRGTRFGFPHCRSDSADQTINLLFA